jgi:hypothetical protein
VGTIGSRDSLRLDVRGREHSKPLLGFRCSFCVCCRCLFFRTAQPERGLLKSELCHGRFRAVLGVARVLAGSANDPYLSMGFLPPTVRSLFEVQALGGRGDLGIIFR